MKPRSAWTLEETRQWLQTKLDEGVRCPCCDQHAKRYRRPFNSGMARSLITMHTIHRRRGIKWIHLPTMMSARSREEGKLAYWGMAEESTEPREDGGRAGYWRVTKAGRDFVTSGVRVPRHAIVYNAVCVGFDDSQMVNIQDCLGKKFDLAELLTKRQPIRR